MRYVQKQGEGGYHLGKAHENPPADAASAESRWGSFGRAGYKAPLQESLLEQQHHLCCYSEVRPDLEGIGCHIEHVKPKSAYPQLTFDFANLVVSALSSNDLNGFLAQEVFGGHAKQNTFDPALFVSCLDADCARYFAYLSDGRVVPSIAVSGADQSKAQYTIDLLNLNSPYLITLRRNWWGDLEKLFHEHIRDDMSLECLATIDLLPRNNKLSQFFSLTRQFFGQIAEDVLAHAERVAGVAE